MSEQRNRYVGLALADSMFGDGVRLVGRFPLTPAEAAAFIDAGVVSCANRAHENTLAVLRDHFGLELPVPDVPPTVRLNAPGDMVLVIGLRDPRRLVERREYTTEEVLAAGFRFTVYTVQKTV